MKALGEAAVDLPWILPCASSLVGLTRPEAAAVWSEVRFDPGCVLLLARLENAAPFSKLVQSPAALGQALSWLSQTTPPAPPSQRGGRSVGARKHKWGRSVGPRNARGGGCFVDWQQPGAAYVLRIACRQARSRTPSPPRSAAPRSGPLLRAVGAAGLARFMRHLRRAHPRVSPARQAAGQLATNRVGTRSYCHHPPAGPHLAVADLAHAACSAIAGCT